MAALHCCCCQRAAPGVACAGAALPRPTSPPAAACTAHRSAPLTPAQRSAPHCPPTAGTGRLNGRSEQLLGRFLDEYPGTAAARDNVRIATKLAAYPWRLTPKQWVGACRASLARTGQERLALAQLHWSTANYAPLQASTRVWAYASVESRARLWQRGLQQGAGQPALLCLPTHVAAAAAAASAACLQERLMWDGLVAIYEEVRRGWGQPGRAGHLPPLRLPPLRRLLVERGSALQAAGLRAPQHICASVVCRAWRTRWACPTTAPASCSASAATWASAACRWRRCRCSTAC